MLNKATNIQHRKFADNIEPKLSYFFAKLQLRTDWSSAVPEIFFTTKHTS